MPRNTQILPDACTALRVRRCNDAAFALFEMKLVLFEVLLNWELILVNTKPIQPTRRGVTVALQLRECAKCAIRALQVAGRQKQND